LVRGAEFGVGPTILCYLVVVCVMCHDVAAQVYVPRARFVTYLWVYMYVCMDVCVSINQLGIKVLREWCA